MLQCLNLSATFSTISSSRLARFRTGYNVQIAIFRLKKVKETATCGDGNAWHRTGGEHAKATKRHSHAQIPRSRHNLCSVKGSPGVAFNKVIKSKKKLNTQCHYQ